MDRRFQTVQVNIRVPAGIVERIDREIDDSQEFASRADYIMAALRYYESYRVWIKQTKTMGESLLNQLMDETIEARQKNLNKKIEENDDRTGQLVQELVCSANMKPRKKQD